MKNGFEVDVRRQVEQLKTHSCREIEAQVARKRISWLRETYRPAKTHQSFSPRDAFELLFGTYMNLRKKDLPVLSDTETEIVWLSRNPCPTLEACRELGLDTRVVCRAAYEKSTQAFLSQLDPQLRFLRSYEEIRPYANHCKERIVRVDFDRMMAVAVEEARASKRAGNKGYGALITMENRVVAKAHDTVATEHDPSLHAEVNAIRQAVRSLKDPNLSGALLFSTCEPCPMCSSLAVWANLTTIVYGASIEETARLGKRRIPIDAREVVNRSGVMIEVIGDVLKDECSELYT